MLEVDNFSPSVVALRILSCSEGSSEPESELIQGVYIRDYVGDYYKGF